MTASERVHDIWSLLKRLDSDASAQVIHLASGACRNPVTRAVPWAFDPGPLVRNRIRRRQTPYRHDSL